MLYKISKFMFLLFLFYIGWFQLVFSTIPRMPLILGVGMILFLILHKYKTFNRISIDIPSPILIWLLFSLYILVSGFFVAENKALLINSWITYVQMLAMMIFIVNISTIEKSNIFFIKAYLIFSVLYLITMLLWGFEGRQGRLSISPTSNPNGDALTLFLGVFCTLLLFNKKKIYQFVASFGLIGLFAYAIILTGSRKSFIALILFLLLWFALVFKDYWKTYSLNQKIILVFFLAAIALTARLQLWPVFEDSILYSRLTESGYTIASSQSRSGMYREAIQFFHENPLWGIGFNHFRVLSNYRTYSHSTYAEIISTTGLVGTTIYFSAYLIIIVNLLKIYVKMAGPIVSTVSMQYLALMGVMLALGTSVIHFYSMIDNITFALMISFYITERTQLDRSFEWERSFVSNPLH